MLTSVLSVAALLVLIAPSTATAAEAGCGGPIGENPFNTFESTLSKDVSCQHALATLHRCAWGSSSDTSFAPIVVKTCENVFYAKLKPAAQRNYATRMQMCAYRGARQEGTMYMSAAALCQADVAARTEADPASADVPVRASFNCEKSRTPLEQAICGDATLGQADIILADAYKGAIDIEGKDKAKLVKQQQHWLASLKMACRLGDGDMVSKAAVACATTAFEKRFTFLDDCENSGDCTAPLDLVTSATAIPRASFDCQKPGSALEIAICADADLGKADLALATAYRGALDSVGESGHEALVTSERKWLRFIGSTCPIASVGGIPSVWTRGCLRSAFETRTTQLRTCPAQAPEARKACLDVFRVVAE